MLLCSLLSYTAPRKTRISVLVQNAPITVSIVSTSAKWEYQCL